MYRFALIFLAFSLFGDDLPKWVRFGAEHRFRFEDYRALRYDSQNEDRWLLNRFRLNLTLVPASWWSFTFQGQDSRVFFKENKAGAAPFTNRMDLRMAYTDLGKGKVVLRVGRQELAYGEQRVLGAGNWGNVARTFDAVKLVVKEGPVQVDLFSASVVKPLQNGISHHLAGNNLHGAYVQWKDFVKGATLEPYFMWRIGPNVDRRVAGLRLVGLLPGHWDYSTEGIEQTGAVAGSVIRAAALHSVLRHSFTNWKWQPHWGVEYNYASGDKTPGDGRDSTFDQLYPTPHGNTGLADQVGWQNVEHVSTFVNVTPWRHLTLRGSAHDWYLAQARDGVFLTNGNMVFRDLTGQAGRHVGEELDLLATYTVGPQTAGAGFGHIFPGQFLQHFSRGDGLNYFYLNVGYRF